MNRHGGEGMKEAGDCLLPRAAAILSAAVAVAFGPRSEGLATAQLWGAVFADQFLLLFDAFAFL